MGYRGSIVTLGFALLATCACDEGEALSSDERSWAEEVTLEVARVNDVMSLEILPALVPELANSSSAVVGDEPLDPDWNALAIACADLPQAASGLDDLAASAPSRYDNVGADVAAFAREIEQFADGCAVAADAEDLALLEAKSDSLTEVGDLSVQIGEALPDDIGCPDDIQDRPQTCDA